MISEENIGILDKDVYIYSDIFLRLMIRVGNLTLIPELYDIFGKDLVIKFLDVFAGTKFEVPSRDVIINVARNADIYVHMSKDSSMNTVRLMMSKHDIEESTVYDSYKNVKTIIEA